VLGKQAVYLLSQAPSLRFPGASEIEYKRELIHRLPVGELGLQCIIASQRKNSVVKRIDFGTQLHSNSAPSTGWLFNQGKLSELKFLHLKRG
jgi:hypothetical protein